MRLLKDGVKSSRAPSLALSFSLVLSACGSVPPPLVYTIPTVQDVAGSNDFNGSPVIAVADVELPGYAEGRIMARMGTGANIVLDTNYRWVDDLDVMVTKALAQRLRAQGLNAWTLPLPSGLRAEYVIELEFDTLLWREPSEALLRGTVFIAPTEGEPDVLNFDHVERASGDGGSGFATATGAGLGRVAARIAEKLDAG